MKKLLGKQASSGIAKAKSFVLSYNNFTVKKIDNVNVEEQLSKLTDANLTAEKQILKLRETTAKKLGEEKAQIFDAHIQILKDPEMQLQIETMIKNEKINASFAIQTIAEIFKQIFLSMDDEYMKEREADISDVTTRLIKIVDDIEIQDLTLINEPVIIVAYDLTPSETSQLDPKYVKGFITEIGGRTSHSTIMARTLMIPAIVGVGESIKKIEPNSTILMDGSTGDIIINPSEETVIEFEEKEIKFNKKIELEKTFIDKETVSKDGWKTKVAANIGSVHDLEGAISVSADGVGLFRTEFLYMGAQSWPTEEEQLEAYKTVLEKTEHTVVIRTLDIGGDKTLNYYKFPKEENPFLGYRAIRMQLDNKEVLETQFRALLKASIYGKLAINIPMIATIDEFLKVKGEFKRLEIELEAEGVKIGEYQLGIMVEIPSVVALADKFAKHVDFMSIGTNDLLQYTFAADRMSPSVSYLYQPFNPSILRFINTVITESHKAGKWTAICGELAGEPMLAPVFVGMGLDEFSMSSSSILNIRRVISETDKNAASLLVSDILDLETEEEVKTRINKFFVEHNINL